MSFDTPEALARHLAVTIDDDAFIVKAVQIKFPGWTGTLARSNFSPKDAPGRRMTEEEARKSAVSHRSKYAKRAYGDDLGRANDWFCSEMSDRAFREMHERGSRRLLATLHDQHGPILERLKQRGRCVVQP